MVFIGRQTRAGRTAISHKYRSVQYERPSSSPWRALRPIDAHTVADKSADSSIESAKVVLEPTSIWGNPCGAFAICCRPYGSKKREDFIDKKKEGRIYRQEDCCAGNAY
jgi:hypothetical protein